VRSLPSVVVGLVEGVTACRSPSVILYSCESGDVAEGMYVHKTTMRTTRAHKRGMNYHVHDTSTQKRYGISYIRPYV